MAAIVKPLTVFEKTLTRASALLDLHDTEVNLDEKDDLLRAAVIISVAGFDRYFTSKYCDVLIPHLKDGKRIESELYVSLEKAGLSTKFALELLTAKRPFRKIRTIVQNSLSAHTTHRDTAIDELFLPLGLKNLCGNAEAKAHRKNLIKRVMKLVDLRNSIAHEAHVAVNGDPKALTVADVRSRINDLKLFVEKCDEIINNKYGVKKPL